MAEVELAPRGSLIAELEELGTVEVFERVEKRWQPTTEGVRALAIMRSAKEQLRPVMGAVWRWVRFRRPNGEVSERTVVIRGPGGEPLREVTVDDPPPKGQG